MVKKIFRSIFWLTFSLASLFALGGIIFLIWGYFYITRDLPRLDSIEDYRPPAVTTVYDNSNNIIAEFYTERRYPVKIDEVPPLVRAAFIAAEDAAFYEHPGIDLLSILRALKKNIESGTKKQGASTITQQVVKKILLTPEKDYRRKIKEAILSYRLEKKLSKDEILEIYLNQMYFGNGAYGIKAAAQIYYHKNVADLTIAESAMLAGLLKAPSRYSPVTNLVRAKKRQRYVLRQLRETGFIKTDEMEASYNQELIVYPVNNTRIQRAHYYASEVKRLLIEQLGSEREVDTGGYTVHTALDLEAQDLATNVMRKHLKQIDKRRGWKGPSEHISEEEQAEFIDRLIRSNGSSRVDQDTIPALVTRINKNKNTIEVNTGAHIETIVIEPNSWARRKLTKNDKVVGINPLNELVPGSVIEVSWQLNEPNNEDDDKLVLDQTPEVEGALILIDPFTGRVPVVVGGYDFNRSQFNRATQSFRQPGSSFKPILYLAAIDGFNYTPTTVVYDAPRTFRVGDEVWTPGNFDKKYMGPITFRRALEQSRNLASADIIARIGVDAAISYARKLGITSDLGRNLSLSLGSSEVTPLEITRAYGVFAARGVLVDTIFITRVFDRNDQIYYDYRDDLLKKSKQAVDENSTFILTNILKGAIERGTGTRVRPIGRPVAGKTGTSNEQMDAWFIGYTPEWVAGVWVGFDLKKKIGEKETGGRIAAPIWLDFMKPYLDSRDEINFEKQLAESKIEAESLGLEPDEPVKPVPLDFSVPAGVDPYWVDRTSGLLSCAECSGAIIEYFKRNTQPSKSSIDEKEDVQSYLQDNDL